MLTEVDEGWKCLSASLVPGILLFLNLYILSEMPASYKLGFNSYEIFQNLTLTLPNH